MDRFEQKLRLFTTFFNKSIDWVFLTPPPPFPFCSLDSISWWPLSVGPGDQVQDGSCLWVRGVPAGTADGQPALLQTRPGLRPETGQRNSHTSNTDLTRCTRSGATAALWNPAAFCYFRWRSWWTTTVPTRPCSRCPPSSSIRVSCASELPRP